MIKIISKTDNAQLNGSLQVIILLDSIMKCNYYDNKSNVRKDPLSILTFFQWL